MFSTPASICLIGPSEVCGDPSAAAATPSATAMAVIILDMASSSVLLVDGRRTSRADHFILRTSATRAADGANHLAVHDQRDAAAGADHAVQGQDVVGAALLDGF